MGWFGAASRAIVHVMVFTGGRLQLATAPTGGGWTAGACRVRLAARGPTRKVYEVNGTPGVAAPRRSSTKVLALLIAVVTALFLGAGATTADAKPRTADPTQVNMTGTTADGGVVAGTWDVTKFAVQNGTLMAIGTFAGTITDSTGTVVENGTQTVAMPVNLAASDGSCQILDLVLGPLDLDLLGLQVHLDQVHLNITAQSGPGNLLGNLLCAVAGLLDGPTGVNAILTQIANLLNQILGVLG